MRGTLYSGVLVFLFSTQNQATQIIIKMGQVTCHLKALSVLIRTFFKKVIPVSRKTGLKFRVVVYFRASNAIELSNVRYIRISHLDKKIDFIKKSFGSLI